MSRKFGSLKIICIYLINLDFAIIRRSKNWYAGHYCTYYSTRVRNKGSCLALQVHARAAMASTIRVARVWTWLHVLNIGTFSYLGTLLEQRHKKHDVRLLVCHFVNVVFVFKSKHRTRAHFVSLITSEVRRFSANHRKHTILIGWDHTHTMYIYSGWKIMFKCIKTDIRKRNGTHL